MTVQKKLSASVEDSKISATRERVLKSGNKLTKAAARYKEGKHHCRICAYYERQGACRIVEGRIGADDGCYYFKRREYGA